MTAHRTTDAEMQEAALTVVNGWEDLREARATIANYERIVNYWFPRWLFVGE